MARNYRDKLKGTNDFLVAAAFLAVLGLWCVKDGWFPSESVLAKHPLATNLTFAVEGRVTEIYAQVGSKVGEGSRLARLRPIQEGAEDIEIQAPRAGAITEMFFHDAALVAPGDLSYRLDPQDSFYQFNRVTAGITLLGAVVCLFLHRAVN